jgi:hypothetical protein
VNELNLSNILHTMDIEYFLKIYKVPHISLINEVILRGSKVQPNIKLEHICTTSLYNHFSWSLSPTNKCENFMYKQLRLSSHVENLRMA